MSKRSAKSALHMGLAMGASVIAISTAGQASAQSCAGTVVNGLCSVEYKDYTGTAITARGPIRITNTSFLVGFPPVTVAAAPINTSPYVLRNNTVIFINNFPGVINAGTPNGTAIQTTGTLINSGAISGSVVGPNVYVAAGGVISGSILLSPAATVISNDFFVDRAGALVSGAILGGNGTDFYVRGYNTGTVTLGAAPLPATFEVEGVEALAASTTLTLAAPNAVSGVMLMGEGSIVNTATINPYNTVGANYTTEVFLPAIGYGGVPGVTYSYIATAVSPTGTVAYQQTQGAALSAFTNQGTVNGDLRIATARFANSGTINLLSRSIGTLVYTRANADFVFDNSGTIALTYNGARVGLALTESYMGDDNFGSAIRVRSAFDLTELKDVKLINSGTINGGFAAAVAGKTISFENSGTISGINRSDYAIRAVALNVGELATVEGLENEHAADSVTFLNSASGKILGGANIDAGTASFSFDNRGTISNSTNSYDSDAAVQIDQGLFQSDADEAAGLPGTDATALTFTNSGSIEGVEIDSEARTGTVTNSGTITANVRAFDPANPPYYGGKAALGYESETNGSQNLTFTNSGTISGLDRGASGLVIETDAGNVEPENGAAPIISTATVKVVNSGKISAEGGATLAPGLLLGYPQNISIFHPVAALGVNAGETTGGSTITIENQANGVVSTNGPLTLVAPSGLTAIPNTNRNQMVAVAASGSVVNITNSGLIEGGTGSDYASNPNVVVESDFYIPDRYIAGAIQTSGANPDDTGKAYVGSIDHVVNTATGIIRGSIDLGANDDIIENYGSITGNIFLRDGNDTFIQGLKAVFDGIADGGAGTDTLAFDITDSDGVITDALRAKFINFEIETFIGTGKVVTSKEVVLGSGGALELEQGSSIDVGAGNTAITGNAATGDAVTNSGSVTGNIDLRGGNNSLDNEGNVTGNIVAGNGNNALANQGTVTGNVTFGNGANNVANTGRIAGDITTGSGNDKVTNNGTITGIVNLGAGTNELVLGAGSSVGGYNGTAGTDTVQATFGGSATAPQVVNLSGFQSVEQFNVNGGTGAVTGNAAFGTVGVNGGRLIGLAGSTITGNVNVANGGTFGSAGTVAGNVAVASGGTFSPGASPAVMTVNGNVALASGSSTLFEFVPAPGQSDQLIVNGNLTIAAGTTLNMVGNRPLTPGVAYDMIVANSITGTFTTVNQASTVAGFLRYTANKLQLLGTFLAPTGVSTQTGRTIDYVNNVLVAGQASSALLAAVPSLLTSTGNASAPAFAQLNGEAYATAAQLGVEHGLTIAKANRGGATASTRTEAGLYGFAQGLGDWRSFRGNAAAGVSRATSQSFGLLGGVGYGSEAASVGAFIGYIDSRQKIAGLSARTDADGIFAGVSAHAAADGMELNVTVAQDWSDASTRRAVPSATVSSGDYGLRSFVLDASAGYNLSVSEDWAVRPQVGFTHVSTRRGATVESGSTAFALTVDRNRTKATFIDGALALRGGQKDGATVHPWAEVGVRHQLNGEATAAAAGFAGGTSRLTALGAARKDMVVTAGAGIAADLAPGLRVHAAYLGEFGGGSGSNVNVGVRFGF